MHQNTVTIYHNPRCSKSRKTLELIESRGLTPTIVHYLDSPPSAQELRHLLKELGMTPAALMRKGEQAYKALKLSESTLSDEELIDAMINQPILIERPIVTTSKGACIGRPPENVLALL